MRIYKISYYDRVRHEGRVAWARTQAEAAQSYRELVAAHDEHNVEKPQPFDFLMTHQGLVNFCNLYAQRPDE